MNLARFYTMWMVHQDPDSNWRGFYEIGNFMSSNSKNSMLDFLQSPLMATFQGISLIQGNNISHVYLPQDVTNAPGLSQIVPSSGPSIIYQCGMNLENMVHF